MLGTILLIVLILLLIGLGRHGPTAAGAIIRAVGLGWS
jgi:hypothetical protein